MVDGFYVIDSHCHIYPEKIASRAVAGTDNFYGTVSFGNGITDQLRELKDISGTDLYIVQSVATTAKQVGSINEFIANEVDKGNGLFVGLGTLYPDSDNVKEDVRHLVSLGLKGVKLHPDIQNFKIDDYRCLKIYELCEQEGLPILMHTGDNRYDNSNPNRLVPVLNIFTGLTIIGAHLGGYSIWNEASEKLAGLDNLYVDCSSSFPFIDKQTALDIIRKYGADKVLYGTDYPMWSPIEEIKTFMSLGLTDDEKRKILSENAKKLFLK